MSPRAKKPGAAAARKAKRKRRKKAWPAGTMLHLTKDKPAKNLVFGPNYTPHRHRPASRPKVLGVTLGIDRNKLIGLAIHDDQKALLARLDDSQRQDAQLNMLAALALTELGRARSLVSVLGDDGTVAVACKWPWRTWQKPRPWEPIRWSANEGSNNP